MDGYGIFSMNFKEFFLKTFVNNWNDCLWGQIGPPAIAGDGSGTPFVVYEDFPNGGATVKQYDGNAWITVGNPAFSAGQTDCTNIAINQSGIPYVVFEDWANDFKATVMKYNP